MKLLKYQSFQQKKPSRPPSSCADQFALGKTESGTYPITLAGKTINVFCDMETRESLLVIMMLVQYIILRQLLQNDGKCNAITILVASVSLERRSSYLYIYIQMNNFTKKISEFSDHCNRQTEEAGLCCREEEILGDRLIISSGLFVV